MSGIGSILANVQAPQVQAPNYSGIGALIAQSGTDYSRLGTGFLQGMQAAQERQKLGILQQQADQQKQMDAMKIAEQKKTMMSDLAFGITRQPEEKQEGMYKQTVATLMQQGIIHPNEVPPQWEQGGKDMVDQLASQSPRAMNEAKMQFEMAKMNSEMDFKKQSLGIQQQNANTAAAAAGQKMGYTLDANGQAIPVPKSYSGRDAIKIAAAQGLQESVEQLRQMDAQGTLPSNPATSRLEAHFLPSIASDKQKQYTALTDMVKEHMEGLGGNGSEINNLLPKTGDSPEIRQQKYAQLVAHAQAVKNAINPFGTQNGANYVQNLTGIAQQKALPAGYEEASAAHPGLTEQQFKAAMQIKN